MNNAFNILTTLDINKFAKFIFRAEDSLKEIHCCSFGSITLANEQREQELCVWDYHPLEIALDRLSLHLEDLLSNKLQLNKEIFPNLGLMREGIFAKRREEIPYELTEEGHKIWSGRLYLLWSVTGDHNLSTWLYTDEDDQIILEITPIYPWLFRDPKEDEKYYSFDEFVAQYKPLARYEISREQAEDWLQTSRELEVIIEDNTQRFYREQQEREQQEASG